MVLVLALLQLACAPTYHVSWDPNHPRNLELYRRPAPLEARIPGQASTEYRYASSEVPMKLTASDGTGLILRTLLVKGVIDDPVSLTELHLSFENPHDQTLDGQFELILPRGAEISRFAMMIGGEWVESEVVERQQAREVYSDHKHIKRDPAILERERGRRFSGRIFPIAPRERKQIILSYTNIHDRSDSLFRVPLAGLPRIDELDVQITRRRPGAEPELLELHSEHEAPKQDFELALDGPSSVAMLVGKQALLRVIPIPVEHTARPDDPEGLSVLVDTSASMAGLAQASDDALAGLLDALVSAGLGQIPLEVLAFDQAVVPLYSGTVAAAREPVLKLLRERARLGASDLGAVLEAIDPNSDRAILISDGDISAGMDNRYGIAGILERTTDRGLKRLDALVLGAEANLEQLEWLVLGERLEAGVVVDAARTRASAWVEKMLSPPAAPVDIDIAGADEVWPMTFRGLRPGQPVIVHATFGKKTPARAKLSLSGAVERSEAIELQSGEDPLIERSIAVLRVKALMARLDSEASNDRRRSTWRELVELSKEHRILNDYTSLLVLESDQAYTEFGIERSSGSTIVIESEAVATNASAAMRIGMEEAKSLPVGNSTQRDFTAVVDITPTASRDSAGISLAGTTSAESIYSCDGGECESRKYRRKWRIDSKGEDVGPRPANLPRSADTFEAGLDTIMRRCGQHVVVAQHLDSLPRYLDLDLALRFDEDGQIVEIVEHFMFENQAQSFFSCARYLLLELGGEALDQRPAKTKPAFEVFRHYTIELSWASGPPPADWRIPEVDVFMSEQSFLGQDGTAGWAKFIAEDLDAGLIDEALDVAWTWHRARPGDLLPYISLGHALVAAQRPADAARAYASLIDLEPTRAEARRFAGALLESLDTPESLELAIDTYRKARDIRPEQPSSYEALALALAHHGELHAAVDVLVDALGRSYTQGRYGDAVELMRSELATLAAAAILADPSSRPAVLSQLVDTMIVPTAEPRDWISLSWESDASHLRLRVLDRDGQDYSYDTELSNEVTNGYGPQGFEWLEHVPGPLRTWINVVNAGPDGVSMGSVKRVRFDGETLVFETRPFVAWPGQTQVGIGSFE